VGFAEFNDNTIKGLIIFVRLHVFSPRSVINCWTHIQCCDHIYLYVEFKTYVEARVCKLV
jgi:hypothetical protein